MRAAIYARVSTFEQEPENQLQELRRYVEARGWTGTEFVVLTTAYKGQHVRPTPTGRP